MHFKVYHLTQRSPSSQRKKKCYTHKKIVNFVAEYNAISGVRLTDTTPHSYIKNNYSFSKTIIKSILTIRLS
jgi:hypothetical protein